MNALFYLKKKCLDRPYHLKSFKGCLPQILLGPFLNTLTQMMLCSKDIWIFVFLVNSQTSKPATSSYTLLHIRSYTRSNPR